MLIIAQHFDTCKPRAQKDFCKFGKAEKGQIPQGSIKGSTPAKSYFPLLPSLPLPRSERRERTSSGLCSTTAVFRISRT